MTDFKQANFKKAGKVVLLLLLLTAISQFVNIYQTSYQLDSPLIPKNAVWEISKQYILRAFVFTVSAFVALIFYFYEKYLFTFIITLLALIAGNYIYL